MDKFENITSSKNNYFAFIDESGNSNQERFFGLGLLIINDEIGNFYDTLKPYYEQAITISKLRKLKKIKELQELNDIQQISQIAGSSIRFELKFKYINFTNNLIYKDLVEKYFSFKNVRFCALVIDRQSEEFTKANLDPWDAYIHRAAMLLTNNIKNISPCEICILADDLTRPSAIRKTFEQSLNDAINHLLNKNSSNGKVFGITRLESHSSLMLQIVDILLGCVMYDFKKEKNIISETLMKRQEVVVQKVRELLKTPTLSTNKTFHEPNYFSVWKLQKSGSWTSDPHPLF